MSNQLHNELRKEFQLERLILFSDAVFAIAITLLVIEIKIPEIEDKDLTEHMVLAKLAHLIPKFIGFLVSFMIIGIYWVVHHRMFGFVTNFSPALIRLNLFFLLAIVLMPFSTGFYSEYTMRKVFTPVIFYTANIVLLGIINFLMWRYISNPVKKVSENLSRPAATYFSIRALTVPFVFVVFAIVYYYNPFYAFFIPMIIPFILKGVYRLMKHQLVNPTKTDHI